MAELNNTQNSGSVKRLKPAPRVDLTAMVDLAFLLITFFMLTTSLAKQNAMSVSMPVDADPQPVSETRTMTICLGKDNKLQWYMGTLEAPLIRPSGSDYSPAGIRKVLNEQSAAVVKLSGNAKKGLIVLIKPSDKSNYKNLVDILDEMEISGVSSYAIVDITQEEISRMKASRIY